MREQMERSPSLLGFRSEKIGDLSSVIILRARFSSFQICIEIGVPAH
jgi:hypothetical protein